ncbi:MAG: DUF3160 domain-containing protein [Bacteroidaceae bacterium]|nr:DUF3160 domain-containing protein [Bacteroidaceae bacterium]
MSEHRDAEGVIKDCAPHSFLITEKSLPKTVDLTTDISNMTYAELRLMKNYVYALHGMWFMEEEMNQFFQTKCDWYEATCYEYLEAHDWNALTEYNQVKLSAEEQAFVERIDQRLSLMEQSTTVTREGLDLRNPALTVNLFQLEDFDSVFYNRLDQHNYAITPTDKQQLFNIYEMNDYQTMPSFITTDVYLQAFHMYFAFVLKSLERHEFVGRLHQACQTLHQRALDFASQSTSAAVRDMAEYNAAFFAIADRLLTGSDRLSVPESYAEAVSTELRNIAAETPALSPMMSYRDMPFAYDLFRPRGHYTRSEAEGRYFRAMMWLQTCTFCRESPKALGYAAMMAHIIRSCRQEGAAVGADVYEVLNFLMGEPDNVSVFDLADVLSDSGFHTLDDLADEAKLQALGANVKSLFATRNRITPKLADENCTDKINYMPQRYTPDAEILSQMYDEKPNAAHPFPSGLDVFSAFGSSEADNIINKVYDYPAQWKAYSAESAKMKKRFGGYDEWNRSMYGKWLECLVSLQNTDKNHPACMQTTAWRRKNLHTSLASWAELKHDAILYAEQPFAAECGAGSDFPDPILVGYVEPNVRFWEKMQELLQLTRSLLEKHGLMEERILSNTEQLESYIGFCLDVSRKELSGTPLDEGEYAGIRHMGSSLEWFTLSVIDPDVLPDSWDLVSGPDRSVAQVADVFTRDIPNCQKCGILYEATGNADAIYVLVEIGGKTYLTRGATFSYYEFVNPLGERLTDEEWQQRLEEGKAPARPRWMAPYIIDRKPEVNEQNFYGTGC